MKTINWQLFEEYNKVDARERIEALVFDESIKDYKTCNYSLC